MSTTGRTRWPMAVALAAAIVLTAVPTPAQVVEDTDRNPSVVQDPGPAFPLDRPIEVRLTPHAQKALERGDGWAALQRGLQVAYDGERPMESEIRVALVTRDGRVLDSQVLDSVTLERGDSPLRAKQIVFSQAEDLVPVAAFAGEKHKPRGPGVFDENARIPVPNITRADERGVMPGDNVKDEDSRAVGIDPGRADERGVGIQPGRADKQAVGINPGRSDKQAVGINPGRFLVITVVPIDARFNPDVQPLIVDLDAKGQTGNPLLAPDDKPDW